tara:strand:+ start:7518 stop:8261 length:744 start_codon:yes stop_codon:yes gene_type:complete
MATTSMIVGQGSANAVKTHSTPNLQTLVNTSLIADVLNTASAGAIVINVTPTYINSIVGTLQNNDTFSGGTSLLFNGGTGGFFDTGAANLRIEDPGAGSQVLTALQDFKNEVTTALGSREQLIADEAFQASTLTGADIKALLVANNTLSNTAGNNLKIANIYDTLFTMHALDFNGRDHQTDSIADRFKNNDKIFFNLGGGHGISLQQAISFPAVTNAATPTALVAGSQTVSKTALCSLQINVLDTLP